MIKKHLACCLITLLGIASVEANAEGALCAYQDKDLTDSLLKLDDVIGVTSEKQVPHPTTEKPLKHVVIFQGGDVAIIEQKNCVIFNLSISMLAAEDTSEEIIVKRISDILQTAPVISKYFESTDFNKDIKANLKNDNSTLSQNDAFELNLTGKISSETAITEMALIYIPNNAMHLLYNRSIEFYLGAGMHN